MRIGHNGGPVLEPGAGWRRHCWRVARRETLERLPFPVVRRRLKRARELGLAYPAYAALRAGGADDIVAILFSTNALRLLREGDRLPPGRAGKLAALVRCGRVALAVPPLSPEAVLARAGGVLDAAHRAPAFPAGRGEMRARLAEAVGRRPRRDVLLVGDTGFEREWSAALGLAGYLAAERYFAVGERPCP